MSQFHLDVFRTARLVSTPPLLRLAGGSDPGLSRGTLLHGWPRASVSLLAFPQSGIDVFREPQAQEGDYVC